MNGCLVVNDGFTWLHMMVMMVKYGEMICTYLCIYKVNDGVVVTDG